MSAFSACLPARRAALPLFLLASTALPALAQEAVIDAGTVTITTADRTTEKKDRVGSKVEVVTRKEIEEKSLPTAADYLASLPGISVSAPGGSGAEGSLSVRGAAKRYVKTLYNGIDISDTTSTQVQTSYQYLLADQLAGIEVLKGSQSTLYGSDAIAGVIALDTLGQVDDGVHHEIGMEGGSHGTVRGRYGFSAAGNGSKIALNLLGMHTNGISAAAGGAEKDAYDNVTADANFEHRFSDNLAVFGSGLYIAGRAEYDDAFGALPSDNPFNVNKTRQIAGRTGFEADFLDGRFRNTFAIQGFDLKRSIHSVSAFGPFDADYAGRRFKAEYQGEYDIAEWLTWQFGADYERQTAKVTDNYGTNTDNAYSMTSGWTQAIVSPSENLTFTAGLRHDEHSVYGGHTTWRATASWRVADTPLRLHGSAGSGFRAPSLYELYGPFVGNTALKPETSLSFDAGAELTLLDGRLVADVTGFILNTDNLIIYDSGGTWMYQQLPGTTKRHGVEVSANWQATDTLSLGAAYTWTYSKASTGLRNPRIPAHEVALNAVWKPDEKWTVSGTTRIVLNTVDTDQKPLDNYVLVNAKVGYKPTEATELYLRGENLLNQKYQTVRGFGTPGLSVYAGFKARF